MICNWFKKQRKKFKYHQDFYYGLQLSIAYEIWKARNDLNPYALRKDTYITFEADLRALEISENFSHDGFNMSAKRLKQKGLKYPKEILAKGYSNPKDMVLSWLNSPTHRKVLLNPKHTYIGVGEYNGFVCVIFAR